jgi:hypothetical protein
MASPGLCPPRADSYASGSDFCINVGPRCKRNESSLIGLGKPGLHRLPSLRTGRAVFPHPALQSVVGSIMEIGARVPGLF